MLLLLGAAGARAQDCANSVAALRKLVGDPAFALQWRETTMTDGRPMRISIRDGAGGLFMNFTKTGEGLWAEGPGRVCLAPGGMLLHVPAATLRTGPAASWLVRTLLRHDARFELSRQGDWLHIATRGWSGRLAPQADDGAAPAP